MTMTTVDSIVFTVSAVIVALWAVTWIACFILRYVDFTLRVKNQVARKVKKS